MYIKQDKFKFSTELLANSMMYKQVEDNLYELLSGRKLNLALIVESLGMQRNTAYYRLRNRLFTSEELIQIADRAVEIYKIKL